MAGMAGKMLQYEMMRRARNEANGEMRGGGGQMRGEMYGGMRNEMRGEMRGGMRDEMRNGMRGGMGGEMYGNMRNEMRGGMEPQMPEEEFDDPLEQRRRQPRRRDGTFRPRNEMYANYGGEREDAIEPNEREGRGHIIGFTDRMRSGGSQKKFNPEMAQMWVQKMKSEDGSPGEHWSMEQVKRLMQQNGVQHETAEVYAIMNALYSDYCKVFKKYGITSPEAVLEMAVAWLEDQDAVKDKIMAYYECVVKH